MVVNQVISQTVKTTISNASSAVRSATKNTSGLDQASSSGAVTSTDYTNSQLEKEDEKLTAYTDNTTEIQTMMQDVAKVVKAVNKKFQNNPSYTTYVEFYINGLHLSTVSQDVNQNIVMSLMNEKNGSGEANKFTIQIAYSPLSNNKFDIDKIDNAILVASYASSDKIGDNPVTGSSRYCALRYGYGDVNDDIYRTPWYFGMVLDYSCEFQDGMLIYTVTGFSGLTVLKESKEPLVLNIPKNAQTPEGTDGSTTEGLTTDPATQGTEDPNTEGSSSYDQMYLKPTEAVEFIVRTYLQGGLDASKNKGKGVEINGQYVPINPKPLSANVCYDIKFAEGVRGSDEPVPLTTQIEKNPAQALTDILNKAVMSEEYKQMTQKEKDPNEEETAITETEDFSKLDEDVQKELNALDKTCYGWFVSDTAKEKPEYKSGTIYVYRNNPAELTTKDADVDIVFNWMSPGQGGEMDHMVLSFKPEFKGSVALGIINNLILDTKTEEEKKALEENADKEKDAGEVVEEAFHGAFYVDDMGRLKKTENSISPPIGGSAGNVLSSIEQEKASWAQKVQYPYKATLVTVGIPCEIPITGRIKVVPMIYGSAHASAGVYMVTKVRDTITTAGFQTEWELMKLEIPTTSVKNRTVNDEHQETEQEKEERLRREAEQKHKELNESTEKNLGISGPLQGFGNLTNNKPGPYVK